MKWYTPTETEASNWREWVESRPPQIRELAERFDPWTLYRLKTTDQRVTVLSFSEEGTLTVSVSGKFNDTLFERDVFGIDPGDMEECDLPSPGEPCGAAMTPDDVDDNIDALRVAIRPDLFEMKDGKARRRNAH